MSGLGKTFYPDAQLLAAMGFNDLQIRKGRHRIRSRGQAYLGKTNEGAITANSLLYNLKQHRESGRGSTTSTNKHVSVPPISVCQDRFVRMMVHFSQNKDSKSIQQKTLRELVWRIARTEIRDEDLVTTDNVVQIVQSDQMRRMCGEDLADLDSIIGQADQLAKQAVARRFSQRQRSIYQFVLDNLIKLAPDETLRATITQANPLLYYVEPCPPFPVPMCAVVEVRKVDWQNLLAGAPLGAVLVVGPNINTRKVLLSMVSGFEKDTNLVLMIMDNYYTLKQKTPGTAIDYTVFAPSIATSSNTRNQNLWKRTQFYLHTNFNATMTDFNAVDRLFEAKDASGRLVYEYGSGITSRFVYRRATIQDMGVEYTCSATTRIEERRDAVESDLAAVAAMRVAGQFKPEKFAEWDKQLEAAFSGTQFTSQPFSGERQDPFADVADTFMDVDMSAESQPTLITRADMQVDEDTAVVSEFKNSLSDISKKFSVLQASKLSKDPSQDFSGLPHYVSQILEAIQRCEALLKALTSNDTEIANLRKECDQIISNLQAVLSETITTLGVKVDGIILGCQNLLKGVSAGTSTKVLVAGQVELEHDSFRGYVDAIIKSLSVNFEYYKTYIQNLTAIGTKIDASKTALLKQLDTMQKVDQNSTALTFDEIIKQNTNFDFEKQLTAAKNSQDTLPKLQQLYSDVIAFANNLTKVVDSLTNSSSRGKKQFAKRQKETKVAITQSLKARSDEIITAAYDVCFQRYIQIQQAVSKINASNIEGGLEQLAQILAESAAISTSMSTFEMAIKNQGLDPKWSQLKNDITSLQETQHTKINNFLQTTNSQLTPNITRLRQVLAETDCTKALNPEQLTTAVDQLKSAGDRAQDVITNIGNFEIVLQNQQLLQNLAQLVSEADLLYRNGQATQQYLKNFVQIDQETKGVLQKAQEILDDLGYDFSEKPAVMSSLEQQINNVRAMKGQMTAPGQIMSNVISNCMMPKLTSLEQELTTLCKSMQTQYDRAVSISNMQVDQLVNELDNRQQQNDTAPTVATPSPQQPVTAIEQANLLVGQSQKITEQLIAQPPTPKSSDLQEKLANIKQQTSIVKETVQALNTPGQMIQDETTEDVERKIEILKITSEKTYELVDEILQKVGETYQNYKKFESLLQAEANSDETNQLWNQFLDTTQNFISSVKKLSSMLDSIDRDAKAVSEMYPILMDGFVAKLETKRASMLVSDTTFQKDLIRWATLAGVVDYDKYKELFRQGEASNLYAAHEDGTMSESTEPEEELTDQELLVLYCEYASEYMRVLVSELPDSMTADCGAAFRMASALLSGYDSLSKKTRFSPALRADANAFMALQVLAFNVDLEGEDDAPGAIAPLIWKTTGVGREALDEEALSLCLTVRQRADVARGWLGSGDRYHLATCRRSLNMPKLGRALVPGRPSFGAANEEARRWRETRTVEDVDMDKGSKGDGGQRGGKAQHKPPKLPTSGSVERGDDNSKKLWIRWLLAHHKKLYRKNGDPLDAEIVNELAMRVAQMGGLLPILDFLTSETREALKELIANGQDASDLGMVEPEETPVDVAWFVGNVCLARRGVVDELGLNGDWSKKVRSILRKHAQAQGLSSLTADATGGSGVVEKGEWHSQAMAWESLCRHQVVVAPHLLSQSSGQGVDSLIFRGSIKDFIKAYYNDSTDGDLGESELDARLPLSFGDCIDAAFSETDKAVQLGWHAALLHSALREIYEAQDALVESTCAEALQRQDLQVVRPLSDLQTSSDGRKIDEMVFDWVLHAHLAAGLFAGDEIGGRLVDAYKAALGKGAKVRWPCTAWCEWPDETSADESWDSLIGVELPEILMACGNMQHIKAERVAGNDGDVKAQILVGLKNALSLLERGELAGVWCVVGLAKSTRLLNVGAGDFFKAVRALLMIVEGDFKDGINALRPCARALAEAVRIADSMDLPSEGVRNTAASLKELLVALEPYLAATNTIDHKDSILGMVSRLLLTDETVKVLEWNKLSIIVPQEPDTQGSGEIADKRQHSLPATMPFPEIFPVLPPDEKGTTVHLKIDPPTPPTQALNPPKEPDPTPEELIEQNEVFVHKTKEEYDAVVANLEVYMQSYETQMMRTRALELTGQKTVDAICTDEKNVGDPKHVDKDEVKRNVYKAREWTQYSYKCKISENLYIEAYIYDGKLYFAIENNGSVEGLTGKLLFEKMMDKMSSLLDIEIQAICGEWYWGTNIETFQKNVERFHSKEDAARSTWTGKMAGKYGYTTAIIKNLFYDCREKDKIKMCLVEFRKAPPAPEKKSASPKNLSEMRVKISLRGMVGLAAPAAAHAATLRMVVGAVDARLPMQATREQFIKIVQAATRIAPADEMSWTQGLVCGGKKMWLGDEEARVAVWWICAHNALSGLVAAERCFGTGWQNKWRGAATKRILQLIALVHAGHWEAARWENCVVAPLCFAENSAKQTLLWCVETVKGADNPRFCGRWPAYVKGVKALPSYLQMYAVALEDPSLLIQHRSVIPNNFPRSRTPRVVPLLGLTGGVLTLGPADDKDQEWKEQMAVAAGLAGHALCGHHAYGGKLPLKTLVEATRHYAFADPKIMSQEVQKLLREFVDQNTQNGVWQEVLATGPAQFDVLCPLLAQGNEQDAGWFVGLWEMAATARDLHPMLGRCLLRQVTGGFGGPVHHTEMTRWSSRAAPQLTTTRYEQWRRELGLLPGHGTGVLPGTVERRDGAMDELRAWVGRAGLLTPGRDVLTRALWRLQDRFEDPDRGSHWDIQTLREWSKIRACELVLDFQWRWDDELRVLSMADPVKVSDKGGKIDLLRKRLARVNKVRPLVRMQFVGHFGGSPLAPHRDIPPKRCEPSDVPILDVNRIFKDCLKISHKNGPTYHIDYTLSYAILSNVHIALESFRNTICVDDLVALSSLVSWQAHNVKHNFENLLPHFLRLLTDGDGNDKLGRDEYVAGLLSAAESNHFLVPNEALALARYVAANDHYEQWGRIASNQIRLHFEKYMFLAKEYYDAWSLMHKTAHFAAVARLYTPHKQRSKSSTYEDENCPDNLTTATTNAVCVRGVVAVEGVVQEFRLSQPRPDDTTEEDWALPEVIADLTLCGLAQQQQWPGHFLIDYNIKYSWSDQNAATIAQKSFLKMSGSPKRIVGEDSAMVDKALGAVKKCGEDTDLGGLVVLAVWCGRFYEGVSCGDAKESVREEVPGEMDYTTWRANTPRLPVFRGSTLRTSNYKPILRPWQVRALCNQKKEIDLITDERLRSERLDKLRHNCGLQLACHRIHLRGVERKMKAVRASLESTKYEISSHDGSALLPKDAFVLMYRFNDILARHNLHVQLVNAMYHDLNFGGTLARIVYENDDWPCHDDYLYEIDDITAYCQLKGRVPDNICRLEPLDLHCCFPHSPPNGLKLTADRWDSLALGVQLALFVEEYVSSNQKAGLAGSSLMEVLLWCRCYNTKKVFLEMDQIAFRERELERHDVAQMHYSLVMDLISVIPQAKVGDFISNYNEDAYQTNKIKMFLQLARDNIALYLTHTLSFLKESPLRLFEGQNDPTTQRQGGLTTYTIELGAKNVAKLIKKCDDHAFYSEQAVLRLARRLFFTPPSKSELTDVCQKIENARIKYEKIELEFNPTAKQYRTFAANRERARWLATLWQRSLDIATQKPSNVDGVLSVLKKLDPTVQEEEEAVMAILATPIKNESDYYYPVVAGTLLAACFEVDTPEKQKDTLLRAIAIEKQLQNLKCFGHKAIYNHAYVIKEIDAWKLLVKDQAGKAPQKVFLLTAKALASEIDQNTGFVSLNAMVNIGYHVEKIKTLANDDENKTGYKGVVLQHFRALESCLAGDNNIEASWHVDCRDFGDYVPKSLHVRLAQWRKVMCDDMSKIKDNLLEACHKRNLENLTSKEEKDAYFLMERGLVTSIAIAAANTDNLQMVTQGFRALVNYAKIDNTTTMDISTIIDKTTGVVRCLTKWFVKLPIFKNNTMPVLNDLSASAAPLTCCDQWIKNDENLKLLYNMIQSKVFLVDSIIKVKSDLLLRPLLQVLLTETVALFDLSPKHAALDLAVVASLMDDIGAKPVQKAKLLPRGTYQDGVEPKHFDFPRDLFLYTWAPDSDTATPSRNSSGNHAKWRDGSNDIVLAHLVDYWLIQIVRKVGGEKSIGDTWRRANVPSRHALYAATRTAQLCDPTMDISESCLRTIESGVTIAGSALPDVVAANLNIRSTETVKLWPAELHEAYAPVTERAAAEFLGVTYSALAKAWTVKDRVETTGGDETSSDDEETDDETKKNTDDVADDPKSDPTGDDKALIMWCAEYYSRETRPQELRDAMLVLCACVLAHRAKNRADYLLSPYAIRARAMLRDARWSVGVGINQSTENRQPFEMPLFATFKPQAVRPTPIVSLEPLAFLAQQCLAASIACENDEFRRARLVCALQDTETPSASADETASSSAGKTACMGKACRELVGALIVAQTVDEPLLVNLIREQRRVAEMVGASPLVRLCTMQERLVCDGDQEALRAARYAVDNAANMTAWQQAQFNAGAALASWRLGGPSPGSAVMQKLFVDIPISANTMDLEKLRKLRFVARPPPSRLDGDDKMQRDTLFAATSAAVAAFNWIVRTFRDDITQPTFDGAMKDLHNELTMCVNACARGWTTKPAPTPKAEKFSSLIELIKRWSGSVHILSFSDLRAVVDVLGMLGEVGGVDPILVSWTPEGLRESGSEIIKNALRTRGLDGLLALAVRDEDLPMQTGWLDTVNFLCLEDLPHQMLRS